MISDTRYAKSGDAHVAYRVIGDGPIDVLASVGYISHVEQLLESPRTQRLFSSVGEYARVLLFDPRGAGLSDPVDAAPTLEQQVDDGLAVLDDAKGERASIYGFTVGAPFALLAAATEPERITHLMLSSGFARMTSGDGYPYGNPPELRNALVELAVRDWGTGQLTAQSYPSLLDDPELRDWGAKLERMACSPGTVRKFLDLVGKIDVRGLLPSVRQPVLLMHPPSSLVFDRGHTDYLYEHLPNATLFELPGSDTSPITDAAIDTTVDEIERFLTGASNGQQGERALRSLLFTDIVDSTRLAASLGDNEWLRLLDHHDEVSRSEIGSRRGRVVKATGDGFFASFDGPERAVRAAQSIQQRIGGSGLKVRAGVHTGECEVRGDDLAGIAVHIGARVAAEAGPDEVLISQTVKDLIVGSDLSLQSRGPHTLKGVPETWELFAVVGSGD